MMLEQIGDFIDRALKNADNEEVLKALREEVRTFCRKVSCGEGRLINRRYHSVPLYRALLPLNLLLDRSN
jgi:hypothetical protein